LACEELQKTEVWMQAYALPYVLSLLHKDGLSAGVFDVAAAYLENLVLFMSDDVREPFRKLIDLMLSGARFSRLTKQFKSCIEETKLLSPATPADVPYLDLKEFLPETLLLTIINDGLTHNKRFAVNMAAALEEEADLQSFLRQALEYEFGRLAFRLANRIAYFVGGYSRDDLQSLIIDNEFSMVPFEPDLLQTYAEISFLESPINDDEEQEHGLSRSMILESLQIGRASCRERV